MFVVILRYLVDLETILQNREDHVVFLKKYYDQGIFLVSGPQKPRNGGVILAQANSREELENILSQDPFKSRKLAEYQIYEFAPANFSPEFAVILQKGDR
jgi:uncharacterized protein YciI